MNIGKALSRVRRSLGLSQQQLADRATCSRIALSRWEGGYQPPSINSLYTWCEALGLVSPPRNAIVTVVDITPDLLKLLRDDPKRLHGLSPSQFEQFVAERLDKMGFNVALTGASSFRDGGIDLIAVPKIRTVGSYLLAGQIKHHCTGRKAGRPDVDRLLAWKNSQFALGLLVTNTGFTRDAHWLASQVGNRSFIRLRCFDDLKRWIQGDFWSPDDWREIPEVVDLAPGVSITIPKPKPKSTSDMWNIQALNTEGIKGMGYEKTK